MESITKKTRTEMPMPEQVQKTKVTTAPVTQDEAKAMAAADAAVQDSRAKVTQAKGQDLKDELDDLLDEIDSVLEENAQEFVANYVQRGGQ